MTHKIVCILAGSLLCLSCVCTQPGSKRWMLHGGFAHDFIAFDSSVFVATMNISGGTTLGRRVVAGIDIQTNASGVFSGGRAPAPFRGRFITVENISSIVFARMYAGRIDSLRKKVQFFGQAGIGGVVWNGTPGRDTAGNLTYTWKKGLEWSAGVGVSWWVIPNGSLDAQISYRPYIDRGRFQSLPHRVATSWGFSYWFPHTKKA